MTKTEAGTRLNDAHRKVIATVSVACEDAGLPACARALDEILGISQADAAIAAGEALELGHTQRGFAIIKFKDRYDVPCSLQASSLATEAAIWFGCDDANPRALSPGNGWKAVEMPAEYAADTRMHLTQDQVAALLPTLQHFVETGEVVAAPLPREAATVPDGYVLVPKLMTDHMRDEADFAMQAHAGSDYSESDDFDGWYQPVWSAILAASRPPVVANVAPQAAATVPLTDSDVFTLIGHADYLRGMGQEDMPKWCMDLAVRIAHAIGDSALADRTRALAASGDK